MPFMVRTTDNLIAIGTPSAEGAARHVIRLRAEGHTVVIRGCSGERLLVHHLYELAETNGLDLIVTSQPRA